MRNLEIRTTRHEEMVDLTAAIQEALEKDDRQNGAVLVFCVHTTCGLTINEGADPDVKADLQDFFGRIAPHAGGWRHGEGNTDAHIRSSLLGVSLTIPVEGGRMCLGRWQHVYLYKGDGPRIRRVILQWLPAE